MGQIRWIFFDVGSTLVDEQKAYDQRAREMLAGTEISFSAFQEARIFYGKQGKNGDAEAIRHFSLTKTPWHSELERPYPEAEQVLAALKAMGYRLGIIANQNPGTVWRLESWGLGHYFDVIAASAELGRAKPDPEIFLAALKMADCPAGEAMMVGDRLDNDIFPAKALGMKTCWVCPAFVSCRDCPQADLVLEGLGALPRLLKWGQD